MDVRIKRAYEPPEPSDGARVLVDRVWPRGRSRDALELEAWLPELGPSTELRRWFGHDPARWDEFRRRYRSELESAERQPDLDRLAEMASRSALTLVYGARDEQHNQAVVLREVLERRGA